MILVFVLIMLSLVLSALSYTNSISSISRKSIRLCSIRLYSSSSGSGSSSSDSNDKVENISKGFSRKVNNAFENNMPR